ncbi:MAG: DUF4432 family protein [Sphingomonadaceae bacterium]
MKKRWTSTERADLSTRTPDFRGAGEIRQLLLGDGPARGQRLFQLRNAVGLELEIAIDRGFDLSALRFRGINMGWNGPTGTGAPINSTDDSGLGLLRSFDGFLVTCGLDHYGVPATGPADHFIYPNRTLVTYPLHGRVGGIPATIESYGLDSDAPEPFLWATGIVRQAVVFGEVLELRRELKMSLLAPHVTLLDTVTNRGARPARHGMLYHFNIGHPLLAEGAVLSGVDPAFAARFIEEVASPHPDRVEQFDPVLLEQGVARVAIANPKLSGLSLEIEFDRSALPAFGIWRAYQSGIFALGLEPHTGLGSPDARHTPGHCDFLPGGHHRVYSLSIQISS